MEQTDAKYEAAYGDKISRLFIFRFLYMFIEMWVIWVWAIWLCLVMFVHFWYMLILGKRNKVMWEKVVRFMRHMTKWQSYLNAITDKRPNWIED